MKKIRMLFCSLILCVGFAGCGAEPPAESEAPAADIWGLTLSAENVTPTGLTLLCKQSGGSPSGELQTGSYFVIEQKTENGWEEPPLLTEEAAWTGEAYSIPKEKTIVFEKHGSFFTANFRTELTAYAFPSWIFGNREILTKKCTMRNLKQNKNNSVSTAIKKPRTSSVRGFLHADIF